MGQQEEENEAVEEQSVKEIEEKPQDEVVAVEENVEEVVEEKVDEVVEEVPLEDLEKQEAPKTDESSGKKKKKKGKKNKADEAKAEVAEHPDEKAEEDEAKPEEEKIEEPKLKKSKKDKKKKGKKSKSGTDVTVEAEEAPKPADEVNEPSPKPPDEGEEAPKPKKGKKGKKDKKKKKKGVKVEEEAPAPEAAVADEQELGLVSKMKKKRESESGTEPKKRKKSMRKGVSVVEFAEEVVDDSKKKKKKKKGLKPHVQLSGVDLDQHEGKTGSHLELKRGKSRSGANLQQSAMSLKEMSWKQISTIIKSLSRLSMLHTKTVSQYSFSSYFSDEYSEDESESITTEKEVKGKIKKKGKKGKKGKKETGDETVSTKESEPGDAKSEETEKPSKKGKKGKKKKVAVVEEEPPAQEVDVMAEVKRMKALADAKMAGQEIATEVETPVEKSQKKKKKKHKKKKKEEKLTSKQKAELAAKLKAEEEEEEKRRAEEEKRRLEEEKRAAIEKAKRETFEQQIRLEQLGNLRDYMGELLEYVTDLRNQKREDNEWNLYVSCPRLPNASQCDQLNTFLHIWELTIEELSMEECAKKITDALQLLDDLEEFLDYAADINHPTIDNWKAARQHFRDNQAKSLDVATYRLLRQIEKNLHRIDIPTADFRYHDDNIALCLWLRIQLPTPFPNPRRPAKPQIEIDYPEMTMDVRFPLTFNCDKMSVRALYRKYDHLSDLCETFDKSGVPRQLDLDLYDCTKIEWWKKMKYKFDNRIRPPPPPPTINENGEEVVEIPPEPVFTLEDEIPAVPYKKIEPTASEVVLDEENTVYVATVDNLFTTVLDDVINLRNYMIIGGIYSLDIIKQPPQPQEFVTMEMNITALYLPKELEYSDLYIEYIPPEPYQMPSDPDVMVTDEEIQEEENKRQEEAYERLIKVNLTLPEQVIFMETPEICFWDAENRVWTTNDIHGEDYDEENKKLTFYLCKLGIFGLAVRRYVHFPYSSWEIRPKADGSITFKIQAPVLKIKLKVKGDLVGLKKIYNSPSHGLEEIFGKYFKLPKLIRIMQSAGVDLFPAFDAFCYIPEACEKHWPMEKNIYFDIAQLASCFNFAWSHWNRLQNRRNVILLMREFNCEKGAKQKNFYTAHVTPLYALYVDCTESSENFIEDGIDNMKFFFASLSFLAKGTTGIAVRNELLKAPQETIFALYELLLATRAKKKLSKKEKARIAAEQAEKLRLHQEAEAAKRAEEERIRLEEERKAAVEKDKQERIEQQARVEQLQWSRDHINKIVDYNKQLRESAREQNEWELYVNCRRLPNPSRCDQMNTYLHLWDKIIDETTLDEASRRTKDVLQLLNELDDLIDVTEQDGRFLDNLKWVRLLFRKNQAKSIDIATYRLLRNVEKNLNRNDIPTADFRFHDGNLTLCLWLRVQLPTPLYNPRRPQKPRIEINFAEMKMDVQFPVKIDCDGKVIRAVYVKYDHLSDLSETFESPVVPQLFNEDLFDCVRREWWEKMKYKFDNREVTEPKKTEKTGEDVEVEEEQIFEDREFGPNDEIPVVPYRKLEPSPSEFVITKEDLLYSDTRKNLLKTVDADIINLRKYTVVGGVYSLDLLEQPPQPEDFVTMEMNLTPLYIPKQLKFADFYVKYTPPAPPEPGVRRLPEEIEEEMKKQEEELDKLILINLTWPDHVIFLELPLVCHWDETKRSWTKSDVHDLKHNEEKGQLSFRTGRLGIFGLAAVRYANLPYQAWEMRPEADGSVTFQITAAVLLVEFNIKEGLVALAQLQNSPNNALQDLIGEYLRLPKLIRIMQDSGVDVFPTFDAFCYVEGTCEKHWPMEKHVYFNMAQSARSFNFAWSRWNLPAGRRNIVMQMREYNVEKAKQKNHSMLHVTPLKAIFVDCTEVSQTFNEKGVADMKFYSDLYFLIKATSNMTIRNKISRTSEELVFALFELLAKTRVLSFS